MKDVLVFASDLLKAFGRLPQAEYQAVAREVLPYIAEEIKNRNDNMEKYKQDQSDAWSKMIDSMATDGKDIITVINNAEYKISATKKDLK